MFVRYEQHKSCPSLEKTLTSIYNCSSKLYLNSITDCINSITGAQQNKISNHCRSYNQSTHSCHFLSFKMDYTLCSSLVLLLALSNSVRGMDYLNPKETVAFHSSLEASINPPPPEKVANMARFIVQSASKFENEYFKCAHPYDLLCFTVTVSTLVSVVLKLRFLQTGPQSPQYLVETPQRATLSPALSQSVMVLREGQQESRTCT